MQILPDMVVNTRLPAYSILGTDQNGYRAGLVLKLPIPDWIRPDSCSRESCRMIWGIWN